MNIEDKIEDIFRLNFLQKKALLYLKIISVKDLLYHFPNRYETPQKESFIKNLSAGESVSLWGIVKNLKTLKGFRTKIPMAEADFEDQTGKIKIIWFNQPYLAKMIKDGEKVAVFGRVSKRKKTGELYISNPQIENSPTPPSEWAPLFAGDKTGEHLKFLMPIYPETRGISSNWFYHALRKIIRMGYLDGFQEFIPKDILEKYHLPDIKTALLWIHSPSKIGLSEVARKRFAFEEIFVIQIRKKIIRSKYEALSAFKIERNEKEISEFADRFPFSLTNAQKNAVASILSDMEKAKPMSRLLEGDVGSGKTAVSAISAYAVISSKPKTQNFGRLQVAYMCPTEVLAKQHFESFIKYFKKSNINIALVTGSGAKKFPSKINKEGFTDISKTQLLKWVSNGEIPILIGTHALIQNKVLFKHLALVIVDEQHRFGTAQRQKLAKKGAVAPHFLSMTATPIPRTLALTIYGDLDITLLDEMPKGRKQVITEIALKERREDVYEKIKKELLEGRQAYIICPRIDLPDEKKENALIAKSAKEEAKRLQSGFFRDFKVGVLHGKMKPKEKDAVMTDFENKKINVLVATSVIEVGVNVPNATIILIEGAERFGLAQLHQLRGRVLRSEQQAYCFLISETSSKTSIARLNALKNAKNGFELAEKDLMLRGAGELYGGKQWGLSDIAMEGIRNIKMVEFARAEAEKIVSENLDLSKYPLIKEKIEKGEEIHFE